MYKNPSNKNIKSGDSVKDLGVIVSRDMSFKEHIKSVTLSCRIISGMLLRTFQTRDREVMLKLFHTYIRSKMEYCCSVWSPTEKSPSPAAGKNVKDKYPPLMLQHLCSDFTSSQHGSDISDIYNLFGALVVPM